MIKKPLTINHTPYTGGSGREARPERRRGGQTLIEAIAAVGITIIIASGLMALGVATIRSATVSRNRSQAVSYAQEGIEAARSIRDNSGYDTLRGCTGTRYLHWGGSGWTCELGTESRGIFTRSFTASEHAAGILSVTVLVEWDDGSGNHTLYLDTYLTDWR